MHAGTIFEPDRVRRNTATAANHRIDTKTVTNIRRYVNQPRDVIVRRIRELEREWDIERVLEANASALALTGVGLAATVNRKWLLLSGTVLGFLLLHAVQGWCPPLPLLRRWGIRTQTEIDREKLTLQNLLPDHEETSGTFERRRVGALTT